MHPVADGHLRTLHRLAEELFDVVCHEFTGGVPVRVQFERVDDLIEQSIGEEHLVTTALVCAQLLRRVTAQPESTHPRHVQTLTDIIEQVLPPLAAVRPDAPPNVTAHLRRLGDEFARTASALIVLADAGGPAFDAQEP
jgi:hypothetical protein